ncbi:hypothetical protein HYW73_04100 [Candidatus Nomurabacteria bacterium]|nr:hypothetical protein [Candidatus Nomurabacteria bacterium]
MDQDPEKPKKLFTPFSLFAGSIVLITIASNFYFFYFKKDYDFIVESPCDTTKEICFQRDCSEEGSCPPNNLSTFKRYGVRAGDFKNCTYEDCTIACENGFIDCTPLPCEENIDIGETCSADMSTQGEE